MCYNYEDLEHRARKRWRHDHPEDSLQTLENTSLPPLITSVEGDRSLYPGRSGNIILLGESTLRPAHFGLLSGWNKKASDAKSTFNARNDTITEKPTWRGPWHKKQRCIVQTSGFYETDKRTKRKYFFSVKGNAAFYYGGLFNWWINPANNHTLLTYAIITTSPNMLVADFHNRMPWIIDQEVLANWMNPQADLAELLKLMQPYPHFLMDCTEVEVEKNKGQSQLGF